jgi:hypothetical protein
VVESAVVVLALLHVGQKSRGPRKNDVVSHHHAPLLYQLQRLEPFQVSQVGGLIMVHKEKIERSVLLHRSLILLDSPVVNLYSFAHSSVFQNLGGDEVPFFIDVHGVDDCVGVMGHEQGRVSTVAPEFEDGFGLVFLEGVDEGNSLFVSNVHHPVIPAVLIHPLEDLIRPTSGSLSEHEIKEFFFYISSIVGPIHVDLGLLKVLLALPKQHILL